MKHVEKSVTRMFYNNEQFFGKIYEFVKTREELNYAAMLYHHLDEEYTENNQQLIYEFYWKNHESRNH